MVISQTNSRAAQFVTDVRARMSDAALQEKYGLSREKFYLYKATALDIIAKEDSKKSERKIRISGKQLLKDIQSGMDDEALMIKYDLAPRQLQSAFRKIISAGLATPMELSHRLSITKSQVREAFVEVGKAIKELD